MAQGTADARRDRGPARSRRRTRPPVPTTSEANMNSSPRKSLSPPAIWAHFAQQAAWKDWVIAALLVLNVTTVVAGARLAAKQPDVVLVAPDGKSTYVTRSVASSALLDFVANQRQQPSDV